MNKEFAKTTPSISKAQIALGKQYEKQLKEYEKRMQYRSDLKSIAESLKP